MFTRSEILAAMAQECPAVTDNEIPKTLDALACTFSNPRTSFSPCARNATLMANLFGAPYSYAKMHKVLADAGTKIGTLFMTPMACGDIASLQKLIMNSDRVVFMQDDYKLNVPIIYDGKTTRTSGITRGIEDKHMRESYYLWSTIPHFVERHVAAAKPQHGHYVNWNSMPASVMHDLPKLTVEQVMYAGSCRDARVKAFTKWFAPLEEHITIITPKGKSETNFRALLPAANVQGITIKMHECHQHGSLSLYIQDDAGNKTNMSPSARFYEMMGAGLPLVFDPATLPTLLENGIDASPWAVHDAMELAACLEHASTIQREQRDFFIKRDFFGEFVTQLNTAIGDLE